jgi:hypothetical protein
VIIAGISNQWVQQIDNAVPPAPWDLPCFFHHRNGSFSQAAVKKNLSMKLRARPRGPTDRSFLRRASLNRFQASARSLVGEI